MTRALLLPSVVLALLVLLVLLVLRAASLRGMGLRPMFSLSRATYPTASGSSGPARLSSASRGSSNRHGAAQRVDKRSDGSRGAAPIQSLPFSSLINKPGAAAPCSASGCF